MDKLLHPLLRLKSGGKCQEMQLNKTREVYSNLPQDSKVLSFSCGDGIWDYILATKHSDKVTKLYSTDIVELPIKQDIVTILKEKVNFSFYTVIPDSTLPFNDEFFDLIIHHDVIEHTRKPYFMIKEQFRTLKKGGVLFFSTPNLLRPTNLIKSIIGHLKFPQKIGSNLEIGDYIHEKEFYMEDLRILVEEFDFSEVEIYSKLFGLVTLQMFYDYKEDFRWKENGHILFCRAVK